MRDSVRLLRVGGVELRLQPMFLALPVVAVVTGLPEGAAGVGHRLALLGVLVGSVLVHEAGHALAARARGVRVGHVAIGLLGGVAWIGDPADRARTPADGWVPALGGPAASLLLAAALWAAAAASGRALPPAGVAAVAADPLLAALVASALMGVVNLVPAFPADGGRALHAALAGRLGAGRATRVVAAAGDAIAFGLATLALAWPQWPRTGILLLGAALLVVAGVGERRLARAREDAARAADAAEGRDPVAATRESGEPTDCR